MYEPDNTPTVLLETLYLSHPIITGQWQGIIIETQDTVKSVAKHILKTSILSRRKLCSWGGETR